MIMLSLTWAGSSTISLFMISRHKNGIGKQLPEQSHNLGQDSVLLECKGGITVPMKCKQGRHNFMNQSLKPCLASYMVVIEVIWYVIIVQIGTRYLCFPSPLSTGLEQTTLRYSLELGINVMLWATARCSSSEVSILGNPNIAGMVPLIPGCKELGSST